MTKFDPPADPYGDEKRCRICDQPMTWNWITLEWECDHPTFSDDDYHAR